jgi:hypothetical protein
MIELPACSTPFSVKNLHLTDLKGMQRERERERERESEREREREWEREIERESERERQREWEREREREREYTCNRNQAVTVGLETSTKSNFSFHQT